MQSSSSGSGIMGRGDFGIMTHDGRIERGKANVAKGLLDNEDTKYYLANKPVAEKPVEVKKSKRGKKNGNN